MKLILRKAADVSSDSSMMIVGSKAKLNHMSGPYMDNPSNKERRVVDAVRTHLHSQELHPKYKHLAGKGVSGHCYVASEACYHLLGGKEAGYKPMNIKHEGESHWYLKHGKRYLDPTHDQFDTPVPHDEGKGKGFLTRNPSKRTRNVIHSVERHLAGV